MSRLRPWQVVESRTLHDCAVFQVDRDLARCEGRDESHPFYRLRARDWVNVVPVTPAGDIVLVRQWRHGSRAPTLEIPGGQVDDGESPTEAAARELWEETGWRVGEVVALGVVNPNPALFANRCFTYLAPDVEEVGVPLPSGTEETEVVLATPDELEALVAAGEIDHALVIAALFWYERYRGGARRYPRTRPEDDGTGRSR